MIGRTISPPRENSILDILDDRAGTDPDRVLYYFLADGEHETDKLTYAQLEGQSLAIAAELRRLAAPGDRVILVYAPGLEFIPALFACFYAGMIAVPVQPPRFDLLDAGLQRLTGITNNCRPAVVLTGGTIADSICSTCSRIPGLTSIPCRITDEIRATSVTDLPRLTISRDTTAVLQYTSGSTGDPKGVIISHGNILANSYVLQQAFQHRTRERPGVGVCWLPFYHDMGLIGNVLQALYVDGPCYWLSPLTLLQRPIRWLEAISRYRAYSSGGPNFAFDLCVRRVTEEQKKSLDLSSWELAAIGAEPISPQTMARFTDAFEQCGFRREAFYPCYGLAEATLFVSGGDLSSLPVVRAFLPQQIDSNPGSMPKPLENASDEVEPAAGANTAIDTVRTLVGCGHAWPDHEIVIVDPSTRIECSSGAVGEIWFRGPSVAQGYWDREEKTRSTFGGRLSASGRGPYLRTGDLGFIVDGELFVSGRIKDLIVIRGQNHYPQDIEDTVASLHPGFRPHANAACGCPGDGEERLVILQEIDRRVRELDLDQLRRDVRRAVAERHQIEVHEVLFLRSGTLPKTSSGKIQRRECLRHYLQGRLTPWKANPSS